MLRIRDGTTKLSASKRELRKVPNDLVGVVAIMRKILSCPVFINLSVNDIPARNVFQLYAEWLAAIITMHKANSILGITVEQYKISQRVSMQQTKAMWGFCLERFSDYRKLFWRFMRTYIYPQYVSLPINDTLLFVLSFPLSFQKVYSPCTTMAFQIYAYKFKFII